MFLLVLIFLSICSTVFSQSFEVPSTWKNTSALDNFTTRLNYSAFATDELIPLFNLDTGMMKNLTFVQTADALSAAVLHDQVAKNHRYQGWVRVCFRAVSLKFPDFRTNPTGNDDQVWNGEGVAWALAAARAALTYPDDLQFFLNISTSLWKQTSKSTIRQEDVSGDNSSSCNGSLLVGGIRENPSTGMGNLRVNPSTVIGFAALSAYLYRITGQPMYLETLTNTTKYIYQSLANSSSSNPLFCPLCTQWSSSVPSDAGLLIEALSVAGTPATSSGPYDLSTLISSSITSPLWTDNNTGIMLDNRTFNNLSVNDSTSKGRFIRSLYEARIRMDNGTDIAQLINHFINTQYNSLMKSAHNLENDFYSSSWIGPPATELDFLGQLAAANLLNAAAAILIDNSSTFTLPTNAPITSSHTSNGSVSSPTGRAQSHTLSNGAVGGIAIGTFVLGAIIAGVVILLWSRRRNHKRPEMRPMHQQDLHDITRSPSFQQDVVSQPRSIVPLLPVHHSVPPSDMTNDTISNSERLSIVDDIKHKNPFKEQTPGHTHSFSQPAPTIFIPSEPAPNLPPSIDHQMLNFGNDSFSALPPMTSPRNKNPFRKTLADQNALIQLDDDDLYTHTYLSGVSRSNIPDGLEGIDIGTGLTTDSSHMIFGQAI